MHSRHTHLTDTEQFTGYSWINHPFSWVISQVVTRRDWFSLIRNLPYGAARLNRLCFVFVFAAGLRYPEPAQSQAELTIDYTIRTYKDYLSAMWKTIVFLTLIEHGLCLPVGSFIVCMLFPQLVRLLIDMVPFRRCISYKVGRWWVMMNRRDENKIACM